jgi:hypothetical protein
MRKFYLFIISILICYSSFSQQLTATYGVGSVKLDWQRAGFPGDTIISYPTVVDITAFGADNTGASSTNTAFTNAVNSLSGTNGVIYFPPGNYLFTNRIVLRSGLILRGAGSANTTLTFDLGAASADLIFVQGSAGTNTPITSTVQQYGNQITVTDPNIASAGSFIKIYQNNEASLINDSWADNTVGQISYLKSKSANTFSFYTRHRRAIPLNGAPVAQVLNMVKGVGIECLKIKRLDTDPTVDQTTNIRFNYAAFCWVKGVESDSTNFAHITISNSSNIEVTGSYFHGSFSYGTGGVGYGVVCHLSTGDCLIENNIFQNLRHAMLLQAGSNGNVYSYNYSLQQKRTELPADAAGDIVLHGNYPYANLFEGNIAQNVGGDASHGKNGPTNVFFRNRAQYYGIAFSSGSGDSSIVMYNEVTATGNSSLSPFIALGGLSTVGANTIASQNHRQTSGGFVGNMETRFSPNQVTTYAHFLEPVRPYFFSSDLQPMGYPNAYNPAISIPARDRFLGAAVKTYCSNRSRKDSIMPVFCNPLSIASHGGYDVHDINETNEFRDNSNCGFIATIQPSGASPVSGSITTRTTVDATVQSYAGKPYLQRHYDIEPFNNPATSTGTITLYFTQQDFNNYNAANAIADPDLPTGVADVAGKANLLITQYHGTGTAPGNYTGAAEVIDPDDANIVWNATTNLWEVTFNVTGFSGFFVSGVSAPLPVTIASFNYFIQDQQKVLLKWEVAEQLDIRNYIVERSADGRNYSTIGSITANSLTSFTYQFTDSDPLNGSNYYRLQIVEDNKISYSRILIVNLTSKQDMLKVYPVPASNQFKIRVNTSELVNTEALLLNADGRLLQRIKLNGFEQTINIRQLASGVYYLKTVNGKIYKVLKQ